MSKVTPEQEKLIVGTYRVLVTDELINVYPDDEFDTIKLVMQERGRFEMNQNILIKGSENGHWLLFGEAGIPYIQFKFNSGKQEQVTYSKNFDTLRVYKPKPVKSGKQMEEVIFIKEDN